MTERNSASPPCDMPGAPPGGGAEDVAAWRKAERRRLREETMQLDAAARQGMDSALVAYLDVLLRELPHDVVAVYWPLPAEPDLRAWCEEARADGLRLALPVVTERSRPLQFREWRDGAELSFDTLGIPAPVEGRLIEPSTVILPCVGFDEAGYRLGAGGGYYDRTFAMPAERPLLLGVGYAHGTLRTIYPQPHDIPLSRVITEKGVRVYS